MERHLESSIGKLMTYDDALPDHAEAPSRTRLGALCDFLILTGLMIMIASCNALGFSKAFLYLFFLFNSALFLIRQRVPDVGLLVIVWLWFGINLLACINFYWEFNFNQTTGALIRLLIAYLALKNLGRNFWDLFLKFIMVMIGIALGIYLLLLVVPALTPFLEKLFSSWQYEIIQLRYPDSWNMFFFNFLERSDSSFQRNSGFMWEPGGFGAIVCFAIYANLMKNKFLLNWQFLLCLVALITTFSTASYGAFMLLMLGYLFQDSRRLFVKIMVGLVVVVGIMFMIHNEIFSTKIKRYMNTSLNTTVGVNARFDKLEYNRMSTFLINMELMGDYPLGYGHYPVLYRGAEFIGVSGIGDVARQWGVIGLVGALILLYLFIGMPIFPDAPPVPLRLLTHGAIFGAFLVLFLSNSIEKNPLFLCMVLTPLLNDRTWGRQAKDTAEKFSQAWWDKES